MVSYIHILSSYTFYQLLFSSYSTPFYLHVFIYSFLQNVYKICTWLINESIGRLPLLYSSLSFVLAGLLSRTCFCTCNLICCFFLPFKMGYGLHPTLSLLCSLDLIFNFGNVSYYFYRYFPSCFHFSTWSTPLFTEKKKKENNYSFLAVSTLFLIPTPSLPHTRSLFYLFGIWKF